MPSSRHLHTPPARRRFLLVLGLLALGYPILRFLGFKVPIKPRVIEVKTTLVPGDYFAGPDFILFDDKQGSWAISRKCTHLGCKLNYLEKEGFLECPCHQSRFTPLGEVVRGPAKKNLPHFKVEKLGSTGGYLVTI